jgi:hypothetical protein
MEFVGFTINNYVFTRDSDFAGTFDEGYFRDKTGRVVGFLRNATGNGSAHASPSTPSRPSRPSRPSTPSRPSASWSSISRHEFLS